MCVRDRHVGSVEMSLRTRSRWLEICRMMRMWRTPEVQIAIFVASCGSLGLVLLVWANWMPQSHCVLAHGRWIATREAEKRE